jgi:hypothetical protein
VHLFIPFMYAAVSFGFLFLGAVAFTVCGLIPQLRKYALSTALWFAMWGPCFSIWATLAGLTAVAGGLATQHWQWQHPPMLATVLGISFALCALGGTILIATAAAWLHQALIGRMTLALFRIYAMLVSGGVGSIWGWSVFLWLLVPPTSPYAFFFWVPMMIALCAGFGSLGRQFAKELRGEAPERFTWLTKAEFEGVDA